MSQLLGNKRLNENDGTDYDMIRSENQNKAILELKKEIEEYRKRERAFITHIHFKEKNIYHLEQRLKQANQMLKLQPDPNCFVDGVIFNEFNKLHQLIKQKDEKILQKEEELLSHPQNQ